MPNPHFNELLARTIAKLYKTHPAVLNLASDELWEPPLKQTDADYQHKTTVSGSTLTWLYRNGLVGGDYKEFQNGGTAIFRAQLTAHGYRLAASPQINYGNMPLGQVAVNAAVDGNSVSFDWVARQVVGG
jgi:hypothetical protein